MLMQTMQIFCNRYCHSIFEIWIWIKNRKSEVAFWILYAIVGHCYKKPFRNLLGNRVTAIKKNSNRILVIETNFQSHRALSLNTNALISVLTIFLFTLQSTRNKKFGKCDVCQLHSMILYFQITNKAFRNFLWEFCFLF